MFNQTEASSDQKEFLEQTKSARRGREERKCHQAASIAIQAGARGFLARTRLKKRIRKVGLYASVVEILCFDFQLNFATKAIHRSAYQSIFLVLNFHASLQEFDDFFGEESEEAAASASKPSALKPAIQVYRHTKALNFIYNEKQDADRFDILCKYVLTRSDVVAVEDLFC